jgi:hypothetical protein
MSPAALAGRQPRLLKKGAVAELQPAHALTVDLPSPASARTAPAAATHPQERITAVAAQELPELPEIIPPEDEQPASLPRPRLPTVLGQVAFCIASVAVVSAVMPRIWLLTLALAGIGLLIGMAGLIAASAYERGFLFPFIGLGLCVPAVAVTLLWPSLVGLTPLWRRDNPSIYAGQSVMSLRGQGPSKHLAEGESPWIDASREAIRIGDVRVRAKSATVKVADFVEWERGKTPKDLYLVIGVRVSNVGLSRQVDYKSWYAADAPAVSLTDNLGRSYKLKRFEPGQAVKGHIDQSSVPAQKYLDDVLIFEAPTGVVDYLRLELPASAFGAAGVVRLEIPKQMIAYR